MTKLQRVQEIVIAVAMLYLAVCFIIDPGENYLALISMLAFYLMFIALSTLFYYFTMARYMVGGRVILYKGIIIFNFGMLTATLTDVPPYYIQLYLIAIHAFSGFIEILRAVESMRYSARSWKLKLCHGLINLAMSGICVFFIRRLEAAVVIYGIALIYSAVIRIIQACRKTKLIYIQ